MALGEGGGVLPVDRHAPVRHDAGVGEDRRAAGDAADGAAVPRLPPQPLQRNRVFEADGIAAGDDERKVERSVRVPEIPDLYRRCRRTVHERRGRRPGGEKGQVVDPPPGQQVGGAQGFRNRREGHQREALDQKDGNPLGGEGRIGHVPIL